VEGNPFSFGLIPLFDSATPELLNSWTPGLLDSWTPGLLDSWTPGLLDSWTPGLLDSWTIASSHMEPAHTSSIMRRCSSLPISLPIPDEDEGRPEIGLSEARRIRTANTFEQG
jgi:hypothetical protein